jgi:hypothetical protein
MPKYDASPGFPGVTFQGPVRDDGFPTSVVFNADVFEVPDYEQIEEWVGDSVCESLGSDEVEPDGCDSDGRPSWLLALGLI